MEMFDRFLRKEFFANFFMSSENHSLTEEQLEQIAKNRRLALEKRKAILATENRTLEGTPNDGYNTPPLIDKEQDRKAVGFRSPVIHQISPIKNQPRGNSVRRDRNCRHIKDTETGEICSHEKIDQQLFEGFQEMVCSACRLNNPSLYALMTKQECMKRYLLPEDTFQLFRCISKPNPHNSNWIPMKLYLKKQIETYALVRYGSWENLEIERKKREEQKFQKTLAKTEQLIDEKSKEFEHLINQHESILKPSNRSSGGDSLIEGYENEQVNDNTPVTAGKNAKGKRPLTGKQQLKLTKKQKFLNKFLPSLLGDGKSENG